MKPQSPGDHRRVAIVIILVAVVVGLGIDLAISSATQSSGTVSVRLIQDSSQPIPGVHIFAYEVNEFGGTSQVDLGSTNSTGYAPVLLKWTGKFKIEVDYNSTWIYGFSGQSSGGRTLDTTLSIPSGVVTERIAQCHVLCTAAVTTTAASITTAVPGGAASITASTLAADCSTASPPKNVGLLFGNVSAGTSTPAIVCVQYYLFSPSTMTLNLTGAMTITGVEHGNSFNGAPNFTEIASQAQLTIGGSDNESEGSVVAFAVTARPGASGTYQIEFSTGGYMLTGSEPVQCAYLGQLIAGNGEPDYTLPGGCVTFAEANTTSSVTIPGISYPLYDGVIYFRVVGIINSG